MHLSKAKIVVRNGRVHVDAVVDGVLQESFVFYAGDSIEHEQAAIAYLTRCGVKFAAISFDIPNGIEDDATTSFAEFESEDYAAAHETFDRVEPHITF